MKNHVNRNKKTLYILIIVFIFMLSFSFALVPLYRVFCQKTGFAGTPQITSLLPEHVLDRTIKINFNTDINGNLPWTFKPLQREIIVKLGELGLAFFQVYNWSDDFIVGIASYNVTPNKVARYFNKVACFCFEEQVIGPRERVDMPVQFFLDPLIEKDKTLDDIKSITLSYTFFLSKDFIWSL